MDKNIAIDRLLMRLVQAQYSMLTHTEVIKFVGDLNTDTSCNDLVELMEMEGLATKPVPNRYNIIATNKGKALVDKGGWLAYFNQHESISIQTDQAKSSLNTNNNVVAEKTSILRVKNSNIWLKVNRLLKLSSTNPLLSALLAGCLLPFVTYFFNQYFSASDSASKNLDFIDEKASDWKTLMNFQRLDGESCNFPIMYPDSIFRKYANDVFASVPLHFSSDTIDSIPKAPKKINGFWGFAVPFEIEGKTKNAKIIITNQFKVKVYSASSVSSYSNAESTCAGEGEVYRSSQIVLLHTEKPYYEQLISFPKASFYTLSPNEIMSFEIILKVKDLGKYHVVVEIPYVYRGKKGIATFNFYDFIAPAKFDLWESRFETSDPESYQLSKLSSITWDGKKYKDN